MLFPFLHPVNHHFANEDSHGVIHEQPSNAIEGGEFLDDAIRMEDVSLNAPSITNSNDTI